MQNLLLIVAGLLVLVILMLAFRVQSLLAIQRGSHNNKGGLSNRVNGALFLIFLVGMGGLAIYYTMAKSPEYTLPEAASEHGPAIDWLFNISMAVISLVVVITHILLMGFSWKYQYDENRKAKFYPDNHKLEFAWTVVPAIVLTFLVFNGWKVWSGIWSELDKKDQVEFVEVEAIAKQFEWKFRYPGLDKKFGEHDFRKINDATNVAGLLYSDPENIAALDDFTSGTLMLPKGRKVLVKIRAKDVIHSFFLPHFRVKMDAVPGMPTYFPFTPTKTSDEMREELRVQPQWQRPSVTNPEKSRYETFQYEVVCAEICGRGHYGMKGLMDVVEQDEYNKWYTEQKPNTVFDDAKKAYVLNEISSFAPKAKKAFVNRICELDKIYNNQIEVNPYDVEKFSVIREVTPQIETAFNDSAKGAWIEKQILVAYVADDFESALAKAQEISTKVETLSMDSTQTVALSFAPEGSESIAVASTDSYESFVDGKYIVVVSTADAKNETAANLYDELVKAGYKPFALTSRVATK